MYMSACWDMLCLVSSCSVWLKHFSATGWLAGWLAAQTTQSRLYEARYKPSISTDMIQHVTVSAVTMQPLCPYSTNLSSPYTNMWDHSHPSSILTLWVVCPVLLLHAQHQP
jgi:hypothetical protein